MGTVYLAEHVAIGKKIALKVLLSEYARKEDLKERFLQEAKAAAMIGHENIVDITDFGRTPNGSVFFAMEFLDGQDIACAIRGGAMDWGRAKPILVQICRAMGAAHAKGIIHRDMKPENIFLIEREGRPDFVKVLDFGIAKVSNLGDGERRLTRTGMIFGTPEYMSPEQAQGHSPDNRVDIYALGVIMYEMLTGTVPFKADTFMGILTKHIFETPKPPRALNEQIPVDVEGIVLKAMSKDRDERYRSMAEMAAAATQASDRISRLTDEPPAEMRKMTPAPGSLTLGGTVDDPSNDLSEIRQGAGRLVIVAVVVALLIAGVLVYALVLRQKPGDPADPPRGVATAQDAAPERTTRTALDKGPSSDSTVAKAPTLVRIKVYSTPAGATIFAGDTELGRTNTTIRLERSDQKTLLRLKRAGHDEWTVEVLPDRDDTIQATLVRSRRGPRRPRPKGRPPAKVTPETKTKQPTKNFGRPPDLLNPFRNK